MGRAPCCSKVGLRRGPWSTREDTLLVKYIQAHGEGHWRSMPKKAGLLRCGKSCRLRWLNYLRPDIKRGNITPDEDDLIIRLHSLLGNRWSLIAGRLPGRTDNEIKNYWNTHLSKRFRDKCMGTNSSTCKLLSKRIHQQPNKKNNTTTKIYLPKPIRLSSRNRRFDTGTAFGSSSDNGGGDKCVDTKVSVLPWPWSGDGGVLVYDEDHDLTNGSDFSCQSPLPTEDNRLDKLYEEYLQLLQLDSFVESLLI